MAVHKLLQKWAEHEDPEDPDGILSCFNGQGEPVHSYVVHAHSIFPYKKTEQGRSYVFSSHSTEFDSLYAQHYAQCQLSMLVTGVQKSLVVVHGPVSTLVTPVNLCLEWCRAMLAISANLYSAFRNSREVPSAPKLLECSSYQQFLALTAQQCRSHTGCRVESEQGSDTRYYL